MELLENFRRNGVFGADIYNFLLSEKETKSSLQMIPSTYLKEMQLNSFDRMSRLCNLALEDVKINGGSKHNAVLSFSPKLLLYQNFGAHEKIVAKFTVKNMSQTTTYFSMVCKDNSNFSIKPKHLKQSKLAPGISVTFAVTFTPNQFQDYMHKVDFFSGNDKYIMPLIALGPRPLFDFPDVVTVPKTPMKIENSYLITIHNIGHISAGFSLSTLSPFYVFPKSACLNPGDGIQITISFKSMHMGDFFGTLIASYESGERLKISLKASTYAANVHLDHQVVRFIETYSGMSRQLTIKIHNNSPHLLSYMCLNNASVQSDFEEKMKLAYIYRHLKDSESQKCKKLAEYDILSCKEHERVYSRIFEDELHSLVADESFLFQDRHFSVTPLSGKLWPNDSTDISISFSPKAIGELEAAVYLDIDGVEGRIPLKITGTSLAPAIKLNVETLDMDRVYVNNVCNYELVAMNKGHITGVLKYRKVPVLFGSVITCAPEVLCLEPGESKVFIISFLNSNQGPYFEEIHFHLKNTNTTLKVYLKGEMVYPSLSFSTNVLDFGAVSLGIPATVEFELINESTIDVNAELKMLSDGPEVSSIALSDFAFAEIPKPNVPAWPKEFKIVPQKLRIDPESQVTVKITLTANLIRTNQTSLELNLVNSDSSSISLPITYNATVPEIKSDSNIFLQACFLEHPYPQTISFTSNNFTGYFVLESMQDDPSIQIDFLEIEGFVKPDCVTCLPIIIKTNELGIHISTIRMRLFGVNELIDICNVRICGVAPIITWSPSAMHWGHVKLLNKVDKILTLTNDSPIHVDFETLLQNNDGKWQVHMQNGNMLAESTFELVLSLYLTDSGTYQNKLLIRIENLKDILVPLSAVGVGTSIIVGELRDRVNLGRHFTKILMDCAILVENRGTRMHTLEWSPHYKQAKNKKFPAPFFTLEPTTFKMAAGEKIFLKVTALTNKPLTITETWYLVGTVEGINKKEMLMECPFEAEFVDTKIDVSTDFIELQYDFSPYSEHYNLTEIFTVKNISTLPLDVEIRVRQPFAFVQRKSSYKIDKNDDNLCGCICYNISDLNIDKLMHESEPYVWKEFVDYVTEKPVPPIRTDYLRFFQDINKFKLAFNLTQSVNELLQDEEAMRLQIVFDTTKHCTLKSKEFCDLIRIKFKNHKNRDSLKVIGRINFPNLSITPFRLDFQCVPIGSANSKTLKLQNYTPLTVCFEFKWKNFTYTEVETLPEDPINEAPSPLHFDQIKQNMIEEDLQEIISLRKLDSKIGKKSVTESIENSFELSTNDLNTFLLCYSKSELNEEEQTLLKALTPLLSVDRQEPLMWNHKLPKTLHPEKCCLHEFFDVIPHRGILKPNESQQIHVIFTPKIDLKVKATLECNVLGGPAEVVTVIGAGSNLKYILNTNVLSFNIRPYHERATEDLKLLNSSLLTFDYTTYLTQEHLSGKQVAKILEIAPACKFLEPNEEVSIRVGVDPGIMGFFRRDFLLEIGPLQHIKIDVIGWGVIPQVYLSLRRPSNEKVPIEAGYRAIATLTTEFVHVINKVLEKKTPSHLNTPLSGYNIDFHDLDNPDEWYICGEMNGCPSEMDIELALERILVMDYINEHPETLDYVSQNKSGPIPGIFTAPYVIDYGVVIVGTTVVCEAEILNYGPGYTRLFRAKSSVLPPWLELKLGGKIAPGETFNFVVAFSPTPEHFSELEEAVETTFHLEVPWGVSIPLIVKAICAVPYLVSNIKEIDFGQVRCGSKVVCSIPLKNIGKATCIWYVTLKLKNNVPNSITVLNSSGKYEPGEGGWLNIAFKPTLELAFEGLLLFKFHMNPTRLALPLVGRGAVPRVLLIGGNVNFPPTLPWAQTSHQYLGITNPCSFPVELIFAHSDELWSEEEEIYQMLHTYYDKIVEMLVPAIKPGSGLPANITTFYRDLMNKVKSYQQDHPTRTVSARSVISSRKTSKKNATPGVPKPTIENSVRMRTEAEIIADEIAVLKSQNADPLKEASQEFDKSHSDSDSSDDPFGVIIFTHGSPSTEIYAMELAYSIGIKLKMPVVNVDCAVAEALCVVESTARTVLMNVLNDSYQLCLIASASLAQKDKESSKELISEVHEEVVQETVEEEEDYDYDTIYKKLFMVCNSKNQLGAPKAGDKKKKKAASTSTCDLGASSMTCLPLDLLHDLMREYFAARRFAEGFVVDSLNSWVLKQPAHALTTVLKWRPRVRDVQLILCHSEFGKWAAAYEERERANELLATEVSQEMDEEQIQTLIQEFEEMDASDYENSSPDVRSVYVNLGLEERRRAFLERCPTARSTPKIMKPIEQSSRSTQLPEMSASKKIKKTETASTTAVSKKNELKPGKQSSTYMMMNMKFNEYQKNTFEQLLNIATNWSIEKCEMGYPLLSVTGQAIGTPQKKASAKKKQSEVHLEMAENELERGFPLVIVTCPCLDYKESLVNVLANCPLLKAARTPKLKVDILTMPVHCKEFTALTPKVLPAIEHVECLQLKHLDELPLKKCECNTLVDFREFDDSNPENVVEILSMWHCTCGKKVKSSQSSADEISHNPEEQLTNEISKTELYPHRLHSVCSFINHKVRLILQPGDLLRCKYSFSPRIEGTYSVKRFVEVRGWPESQVVINATGICDLPRLDRRPKKVFTNFVRRTAVNIVYKAVFLDDRKVFEFGPIFIGADRVYEEFSLFQLRNSSLLDCDVIFSFLENTEVFKLGAYFISLQGFTLCNVRGNASIEPGCKTDLKVLAAPSSLGEFRSTLLFSIKNNPEIIKIHISCTGVVPDVDILPASKVIDYGKLLLYRREEDRFIVKNDSILPILWKIRNPEAFLEHFILGATTGVVDSYNNQIVVVTYIACDVGIITNVPLIIDIYAACGRGAPMLSDTLYLSAECYDVLVDCAFEVPTDSGLNYGDVKVNSRVEKEIYFLNRGKYDIFYKIKKVKNFPEPSFLKTMEISQDCGIIPPNMRMVDVQFTCTPTTRMDLQHVPAFICSFIDGTNNQVVVSKYPIRLSIASFYNTFTLFPLGELNFHVIPIGVINSKEIIINNTSRCPITYEIEIPAAYQGGATSSARTVKDSKAKKAVVPGINCGNFTIMNDDSILAPGASRKIEVQFFATKALRFAEVINFLVNDTCPSEAVGVPLTLVGTGAIPSLDIWNLDTTFREHLILKSLKDYQVQETCPHCVLIEDSVTLHFFCVTVNNSYTANIDLYNNGLVPAALTMKLHYQDNSDSSIFLLDKYSTYIEPLVHRNLAIVFSPKSIQEYRAVLEVRLKLLHDQEDVYKICLIGEGVIPRINILKPVFKEVKTSLIHFPATLINSLSSKSIRMINISSVSSTVIVDVIQPTFTGQPIFWLTVFDEQTEPVLKMWDSEEFNTGLRLELLPKSIATVHACYSPSEKGKNECEIKVLIVNNPYEYFTIMCKGEAFLEDVTLTGIKMLPMDYEIDMTRTDMDLESLTGKDSLATNDGKKKSKAPESKKDSKKKNEPKKNAGMSGANIGSQTDLNMNAVLKYELDLGGCELGTLHRRSATLINHSLKVYKFTWYVIDNVAVKPTAGYISPGEEKDVEISFLSDLDIVIEKMNLCCYLMALGPNSLELSGSLWDSRETITVFEKSREADIFKRFESVVKDPRLAVPEDPGPTIEMFIVFSAIVEHAQYTCSLTEDVTIKDTFMYQTRTFDFEIANTGVVPLKISWSFNIDEEYPTRIDLKPELCEEYCQGDFKRPGDEAHSTSTTISETEEMDVGTLFSDNGTRASADTWFAIQLPFSIEPEKECIDAGKTRKFIVTFSPTEAFCFKIKLNGYIEKLHADYENVSVRVVAKSLVPYCHLDAEESDYVTAGRRKANLPALPANTRVLEFHVLGARCYKKKIGVVNPTGEAYQFFMESVTDIKELVPVHCDTLESFLPSGKSTEICFTFAPSDPGTYESLWKFRIPQHSYEVDLLVVGIVREPDVSFVPTILTLNKTLVGGATTSLVRLKNRESDNLEFRFLGNSLCNESGKQPVIIEPEMGTVNASSETCINITYKPITSGNLSFKIFCEISFLLKPLVLCVNALSHLVKPKVTYFLQHYDHELLSDAVTNIHIEKVASHYKRYIRFVVKNEGTVAFAFHWQYVNSPVRKFMDIDFSLKEGCVQPGEEIECEMSFVLRDIPVVAYPVNLIIVDGPEYNVYLHAEICKPSYQFSFTDYNFGKCIVNAPDTTYRKHLVFTNNDSFVITLDLNFENLPEIFVEFNSKLSVVQPKQKLKILIYFRPKQTMDYLFVLPFRINSLVENDVTIKGEGVPLMFDLFEGCQKTVNLGAVRVGDKVVREVDVMNHSKVAIEAQFLFEDTSPVVEDTAETDSQATSVCLSPTTDKLDTTSREPLSRCKLKQ